MWWLLQQQMNGLVPFVCVSGWGCSPRCRWKLSPRCTPNRWWRDAGTGCCPGRWWTGAACELHCSCSECWMHSACGSSVRILQGAACIIIPARERQDGHVKVRVLVSQSLEASPSHLSPCLTSPNSISPQWSQKAGARYECTLSAWGRIWKSSKVAAAERSCKGRVRSPWMVQYNLLAWGIKSD